MSNVLTQEAVVNIFKKYILSNSRAFAKDRLEDFQRIHADGTLNNSRLNFIDWEMTDMIVQMYTWLVKGTNSETTVLSVDVPASWFDHLKHDLIYTKKYPGRLKYWLLSKLKPPKYIKQFKTAETTIHVCPHFNSYLDENEDHFRFLTMKNPLGNHQKSEQEKINQVAMRLQNDMQPYGAANAITIARILTELVQSIRQEANTDKADSK